MSEQKSPYSQPPPMRCLCVATQTMQRAASFLKEGDEVKISNHKITTTSVLCDSTRLYLAHKSGDQAEFLEDITYVFKNYTLSVKYGQECIFLGLTSAKFKSAPLSISEEACARAHEALCPSSYLINGGDSTLFTRGGYLTLLGHVERVS